MPLAGAAPFAYLPAMAKATHTTGDDLLRLLALDADDLRVISAHVQDAVLQVGDLVWLRREARFVLPMNRFAWEAARSGFLRKPEYQRRRSVLHFDRVQAVHYAGFDSQAADQVLSVLAVTFQADDPPSGTVEIHFAGGGAIRLTVECIEARLADLGPAWSTPHVPRHSAGPG